MIIEWIYIIALLFIISLYQYNLSLPILIIIFILIYSHLKPSLQINEGFEKSYMGFPAGYFKIRSRLNGKCLDVNGGNTASGSRIVLWDCHDGLHQQWYTDNLGRLKNRLSNRCLDVIDAQQSNGTAVQIWDCLGGTNQQWYVDAVGHIKTKMNTVISPGFCITRSMIASTACRRSGRWRALGKPASLMPSVPNTYAASTGLRSIGRGQPG